MTACTTTVLYVVCNNLAGITKMCVILDYKYKLDQFKLWLMEKKVIK